MSSLGKTDPASPTISGTNSSENLTLKVNEHVERKIQDFELQLKRRQVLGSVVASTRTAELMKMILSSVRANIPTSDLIRLMKNVGRRLIDAAPVEIAIGNTIRRVLFMIREEYLRKQKLDRRESDEGLLTKSGSHFAESAATPSLHNMLGMVKTDLAGPFSVFKSEILEVLSEFIDEMGNVRKNIADQALEHIHAHEVVMTYGSSMTVSEFLIAAARKRRFEVIVAECAPTYSGHKTCTDLAKAKIETTLITDSAIFAMMARVNKVIIPTHGVMANGGLIAPAGTHMLAQAAKFHSVPLVVCTGLYKLSPLFPIDQDSFQMLNSPADIINIEEADNGIRTPIVHNPAFDYIPPELVSLFITNYGAHNPSYVYRLLQEYYDPEDYDL